ncbi:hypothetical protein JCM8547_003209 [Rhodosporidiobolus lusitaniae]
MDVDDYFSFPSLKHDELPGEALMTPAEQQGYISPLDSPVVSSLSSKLRDAATLPLPDQADYEAQVVDDDSGEHADGGGKASVRSPSAFATVLDHEDAPPPPAQVRFLHGGPPLSELEAPSVTIPGGDKKNRPVANSEWRAFTDEEEARLQERWQKVKEDKEAAAKAGKGKEKEVVQGEAGMKRAAEDEDSADEPLHLVPVGLDNLFTVHLLQMTLFPAFWTGTPVRVIRCHWFYLPPSSQNNSASLPSHHLKPFPVDPSLSASLDRAYSRIRPWESAYADELSSALKGGAEAQQKLAVALAVENEAETAGKQRDLGIEVIFEGKDRGRVYSRGWLGSTSKGLFSSGKSLGGGQVVLRGWDALRSYLEEKAQKKPTANRTSQVVASSASAASDSEGEGSRTTARARTASTATAHSVKRSESPAPGSGFFSSLKNRIVGAPAPSDGTASDIEDGTAPVNDTQAALEGEPRGEGSTKVGDVEELVLIVHGIGQKLSSSFESFGFVYAANAFRSACTSLSTSETLSPLLKGKRAQVIPVLWRTDLDFDELEDDEETADEHLANHFSLKDIEIPGSVPFLRQVVSDLVLDVLFYQQSEHKQKMLRSVVREANRIYHLFKRRNPSFSGKVSIIAHSLGSCLVADILSSQPTFVKVLSLALPLICWAHPPLYLQDLSKPSMKGKHDPSLTFAFDTRVAFLVGSPLALFLRLGRGQLIARAGRERTKNVGKDIALARSGRYGCFAVDTVYNVYDETDPVAFALNATVDARYAKLIKPVPIPSSNVTLLQNLSDAYSRVSRIFDWSSLWTSSASASVAKPTPEQAKEQAVKQEEEERKVKMDEMTRKEEKVKVRRPGGMKRMPSERPKYGMGKDEFEWVARAEKRFKALNPSGTCDYVLPAEGLSNEYIQALYSHGGYWTDRRFVTFVLSQLFAEDAELEKAGRDEMGIEEEEEP